MFSFSVFENDKTASSILYSWSQKEKWETNICSKCENRAHEWKFHGLEHIYIHRQKTSIFDHSLEVMLVWLACVLASQPLLIFLILFLKHGRSSTHLQSRTTLGRKTATINEGGVYQMNWLASTHLFQANTSAWTVQSSRDKYPILLWKEKQNSKLFIFPNLAKKSLC